MFFVVFGYLCCSNLLLSMRKHLYILCLTALLVGCSQPQKTATNTMIVSIMPLKYIVENIVGDDFNIDVVVPAGASPETYEPTPAQMERIENADMIFAVGLMGFEQATIERMTQSARNRYVALSDGIELHGEHAHHGCHEGANPHLWTSPQELKLMSDNAYRAIAAAYPDSTKYAHSYEMLCDRLDSLEREVAVRCEALPSRSFVIYHSTFHYLAEHYNLNEIAIEHDGKEPSAKHIREVIDKARTENATKVFYQKEFPQSVVQTIATELNSQPIEVDILEADVPRMILEFIDKLAE